MVTKKFCILSRLVKQDGIKKAESEDSAITQSLSMRLHMRSKLTTPKSRNVHANTNAAMACNRNG